MAASDQTELLTERLLLGPSAPTMPRTSSAWPGSARSQPTPRPSWATGSASRTGAAATRARPRGPCCSSGEGGRGGSGVSPRPPRLRVTRSARGSHRAAEFLFTRSRGERGVCAGPGCVRRRAERSSPGSMFMMNVVSSGGIEAHPAGEHAGRGRLHPANADPPGPNNQIAGSLNTPRSLRSAKKPEQPTLAPALALALAPPETPRPPRLRVSPDAPRLRSSLERLRVSEPEPGRRLPLRPRPAPPPPPSGAGPGTGGSPRSPGAGSPSS